MVDFMFIEYIVRNMEDKMNNKKINQINNYYEKYSNLKKIEKAISNSNKGYFVTLAYLPCDTGALPSLEEFHDIRKALSRKGIKKIVSIIKQEEEMIDHKLKKIFKEKNKEKKIKCNYCEKEIGDGDIYYHSDDSNYLYDYICESCIDDYLLNKINQWKKENKHKCE